MSHVRPLYLPMTYQDAPDHGRLILRDGSTATIRLSQAADLEAVREFYTRLSPQSRRMRFFSETKPGVDVMMNLCDSSNPRRGMTLIVLRFADGGQRIVATGSYIAHNETTAEFAVAVDDSFHGKGLGGLLLERLSVLAASHGFLNFSAFTHNSNTPMLDVFRNSGFHVSEQQQDGVIEVNFTLLPGQESMQHAQSRDRLFTKASIRPFFCPRSIAVIGASRDPGNVGHRLFMTLLRHQFKGVVYPVNPQTSQVSGVKAYASADELPEAVDLAIIAVPRDEVNGVVDQCARRGVRALIVISTGYAETGEQGRLSQQALLEKVRGYGMRLLGPNCLGLINTDPEYCLNASLSADYPRRGKVALSSQSGALGMALLNLARRRNIGLSMFISMGNKADVTGNDLLYYWEDDPAVDVILLYLESFGNPRRFGRIAREVSRCKPIVCVKAGRHRDSPDEIAVDALFKQSGVIRMATLEEMFDVAVLLGTQPLPSSRGVAIITNSHGAGVLCEDACTTDELEVSARRDLSGDNIISEYESSVFEALQLDRLDAVIAIYIPLTPTSATPVLDAIGRAMARHRTASGKMKPVVAVLMNGDTINSVMECGGEQLPCYQFPETAVHALAAANRYREWRETPPGFIADFEDTDLALARNMIQKKEINAAALLKTVGIESTVRSASHIDVEIEITQNPLFGPVISFSLAGYHREVLQDITYRMAPLTDLDARSMMESIRGFPLLNTAHADLDALQELLLRLSLLIEELPEIEYVRLAPVFVYDRGNGCAVGNSLIRLSSPP